MIPSSVYLDVDARKSDDMLSLWLGHAWTVTMPLEFFPDSGLDLFEH